MYFETTSCSMLGMDSRLIRVETDVSEGFPRFEIIGLADSAVKEAVDRVRTAMKNAGYLVPLKRVTVNLAPAGFRKAGSGFDLAIAVAVLGAMGAIDKESVSDTALIGELSLNSSVKGVAGALPLVCFLRDSGINRIILPSENYLEVNRVPDVALVPVDSLSQAVRYLKGGEVSARGSDLLAPVCGKRDVPDFEDVKGQLHVRRAVEVAAAGRHHMLMMGPPGAGKTMVARRVPGILPNASFDEQLEISKIYSLAGLLNDNGNWIGDRPFRSPHHTTTLAGLAGGGRYPMPGEISLSHNGVLFLDELPEFKRHVMEALREPLEEGRITLVRSGVAHVFPADFMLVASMNPCPCGHYPDRNRCSCTWRSIRNYYSKVSGPLLDRIDIQIEVEAIPFVDLADIDRGESTGTIRNRILDAQGMQGDRNRSFGVRFNCDLPDEPEKWGWGNRSARELMESAFKLLGLTARSYHKVLKVARTIADLDGSDSIADVHIAEAVGYRFLDRRYRQEEGL